VSSRLFVVLFLPTELRSGSREKRKTSSCRKKNKRNKKIENREKKLENPRSHFVYKGLEIPSPTHQPLPSQFTNGALYSSASHSFQTSQFLRFSP